VSFALDFAPDFDTVAEPPDFLTLPPSGMLLRMISPYLLEAYPLSDLPADCGGPPPGPEPLMAGGDGEAFRGASVMTVNLLTTIQQAAGVLPTFTPIDTPDGYRPECDPMAPMIYLATAYLGSITCRDFGNGIGCPIPPEMVPLAIFADALYVEQLTYRMDASRRASSLSSGTGNLRSFTAGPYSESYFGPGEIKFAWNVLDPDPLLNSMLMSLITPECLQARMAAANGTYPPGWATQEVQWDWPGYGPYGSVYGGLNDPYYNPCRGGDWLP
jgi:hypothetical protein